MRSSRPGRLPGGSGCPRAGGFIEGTPEKRAADDETLLAFARKHETRFVISDLHRDYDALWEKIKDTAPEASLSWRDCGLLDDDGRSRPAYRAWERSLALPLAR